MSINIVRKMIWSVMLTIIAILTTVWAMLFGGSYLIFAVITWATAVVSWWSFSISRSLDRQKETTNVIQ